MPVTFRRVPRLGEHVAIHRVDADTRGTIAYVSDDLREVIVTGEDGTSPRFRYDRLTAAFIGTGESAGARLVFDPPQSA